MPRRVELLSGAYLDYYYHCTVIVVSWYVPNGDLRGGAFLQSSSSATQRALSMDTRSSTDLFSDDINAEYEIRSAAPFFLAAIIQMSGNHSHLSDSERCETFPTFEKQHIS